MLRELHGGVTQTRFETPPGFSFDLQPRTDFNSWYIDPPDTASEGYIGGVEHVVASVAIWLSRDASEDAEAAALALAGDLARLRHAVVRLDVEAVGVDVNIHQGVTTTVQPRAEGEVVVVGRLLVQMDYETDGENP